MMENLKDYNNNEVKKTIINCKIIDNKKISKYIYKIDLELPLKITFLPGQFINVLISNHNFDPLLRRPFSIYDYDGKSIISVLYQIVGKATKMLSEKKKDEKINIIGPLGNNFKNFNNKIITYDNKILIHDNKKTNKQNNNNYYYYNNDIIYQSDSIEFINFYIAGGIGIAPILFKAKEDYNFIIENNLSSKIKIYLFYGSKNFDYFVPVSFYEKFFNKIFISFDEKFDYNGLNNKKNVNINYGQNIIEVFKNFYEKKLNSNRDIEDVKIGTENKYYNNFDKKYHKIDKKNKKEIFLNSYLCGPKPMIKEYNKNNFKINTEVSMESYMACGFHACLGCAIKTKRNKYSYVCHDGPVFDINDLIID